MLFSLGWGCGFDVFVVVVGAKGGGAAPASAALVRVRIGLLGELGLPLFPGRPRFRGIRAVQSAPSYLTWLRDPAGSTYGQLSPSMGGLFC